MPPLDSMRTADTTIFMNLTAPDLTVRPPRSSRARLGGFVLLPRVLDKGRATLAGKAGEYIYNCPLDQRFFAFVGMDAETFKRQLATGCGDGEALDWLAANSATKPTAGDIAAWSAVMEQRAPADLEAHRYFCDLLAKCGPDRKDIATWFDLLDLDDFVSFGGKA